MKIVNAAGLAEIARQLSEVFDCDASPLQVRAYASDIEDHLADGAGAYCEVPLSLRRADGRMDVRLDETKHFDDDGSYIAAFVGECRLTDREHAHLTEEAMIAEALAESDRAGLGLTADDIEVGEWTERGNV